MSSSAIASEILSELQLILQQKDSLRIFNGISSSSAPSSSLASWTSPSSYVKSYGDLLVAPFYSPSGSLVCFVQLFIFISIFPVLAGCEIRPETSKSSR